MGAADVQDSEVVIILGQLRHAKLSHKPMAEAMSHHSAVGGFPSS